MKLKLTAETERLIRTRLEKGAYASAEEVVTEALRALERRDADAEAKLAELRKAVQLGMDQLDAGEHAPFDTDRIRNIARARHGNG